MIQNINSLCKLSTLLFLATSNLYFPVALKLVEKVKDNRKMYFAQYILILKQFK